MDEFWNIGLFFSYCPGAVGGVIVALLLHRSLHPFLLTVLGSLIGVTAIVLVFDTAALVVEGTKRAGFDPSQLILAGIGNVIFMGIPLTIVYGVPALFAGLVTQFLLQRCARFR